MSSPNQLFLVVEVIQQCRWTAYGKQREGDVDPGCVVVIRPCNGGNEFEVHRGLGVWITPVLISREGGLPRDKVVAITNQEFDILMGTKSDNARVELHSSGRLKWACRLKVGDEVQINSECTVPGVIRGNGTSPSNMPDYGLQFILDITVNPVEIIIYNTVNVITVLNHI